MSCDWSLHCLDCDETLRFNDLNHWDEQMSALAKSGPAIAAFAPVIEALYKAGASPTLHLAWSRAEIDFKWFVVHGSHRLVPIDEYGRCLDECGVIFTCGACQHEQKCRRKQKHEGQHDHRREDR